MADQRPNTSASSWHQIVHQRRALIDENRASPSSATEARIFDLEDQLLDMGAADIEGVILKLEMLFEQYMHEQSHEAYQRLGVIGDLRRLASL